jgi:hypothetical protein
MQMESRKLCGSVERREKGMGRARARFSSLLMYEGGEEGHMRPDPGAQPQVPQRMQQAMRGLTQNAVVDAENRQRMKAAM